MADTFKVGDPVKLTSGGALMTVEEVQADGDVHCTWFNVNNELKRDVFHPAMLVLWRERPLMPSRG